jgi:chromosome segregation ATPase
MTNRIMNRTLAVSVSSVLVIVACGRLVGKDPQPDSLVQHVEESCDELRKKFEAIKKEGMENEQRRAAIVKEMKAIQEQQQKIIDASGKGPKLDEYNKLADEFRALKEKIEGAGEDADEKDLNRYYELEEQLKKLQEELKDLLDKLAPLDAQFDKLAKELETLKARYEEINKEFADLSNKVAACDKQENGQP